MRLNMTALVFFIVDQLIYYLLIFELIILMKGKGKTRPKSTDKRKSQKKQEHEEPQAENEAQEKKEEKHHFSLYDLLEVAKEASADEIKKQYRKLVLQYHPDKNKDDPSAREKFQKLKEAYDILIDPQKRKEYDQTGRIGDQFDEQNFEAAYNYFRSLYKKVTPEDIKQFEQRYRFGEMQKEDLINYYNQHSGDMTQLLQCIPLSVSDDIPRFIKFFEQEIAKKAIQKYKIFDKTKGKVRLLKDESEQFEKEKQKDMGALVAAIQGRSSNQKDFLAELEAKYGGKKKADPKLRKKKE